MEKKLYEIGRRIKNGEKTTFAERNIYYIEVKKMRKANKLKQAEGKQKEVLG